MIIVEGASSVTHLLSPVKPVFANPFFDRCAGFGLTEFTVEHTLEGMCDPVC